MIYGIISLLMRLILMLIGVLVIPVAILTAKDGKFRWLFFIWDNYEDGFDGDRLGWYSNHLGRKPTLWDAYWWSAFRNPVYNLKYVPFFYRIVNGANVTYFKGNSYHKQYAWSFNKHRKTIWYLVNCKTKEGSAPSAFLKLPITKTKSFSFQVGWKVPVHLLLDSWHLDKIKKEGFPEHKDKCVFVLSMTIRNE